MPMNKNSVLVAFTLLLAAVFFTACGARAYGDTDEYCAFLKERAGREMLSRSETAGDYTYVLQDGVLIISAGDGEIWRTGEYWFVEDFRVFDVDGDGEADCLINLWKSYSFHEGYDGQDDPAVKNHMFLYTVRGGQVKELWLSSNLPRAILSFEVSAGTPTPTGSGTVLTTCEALYDALEDESAQSEHVYTWQGWGFVPQN